jgi:hypothetical protein
VTDSSAREASRVTTAAPSPGYLATNALALFIAALPLLVFPIPPLFDYPAHLARELIIHDLLTQGDFSSMYQLHIAVIPNLGMEAIVLPLLFLGIPVELAGRIFLVLIVILLGTATLGLHRALFRNASFGPLLSFAFILNPVFMFGFANYLLGLALALHGFAWWLRAREKPVAAILPRLVAWTVVLFFCHLTAVALFTGLICSYEASLPFGRQQDRHAQFSAFYRALMLLIVPLLAVAFLYHLAPLSTAPQTVDVHSIGDMLTRIPTRLKALPSYLAAYSRPIDAMVLLTLGCILVASGWLGRLRVSWPMLTPIVGLLLVYVLVPEKWAGTDYISYRIPVAALFLFFASVDIAWDRRYLLALSALGILGLRTGAALSAWAAADAQYQPMLQAIAKLPPHTSIYTGVNYRDSFEPLVRMPWSHFEAYAAIRNRLFVQGIWADPTQDWIVPTPQYAKRAQLRALNNRVDRNTAPARDSDMFNPELLANFDFLVAVQPELYQQAIPAGIQPIARSGSATLFSLHGR